MRLVPLVACALVWAGCYRPGSENNCAIRCTNAQPCAGAMSCENGLCRDPVGPACSSDAVVADAADPDAYLDAPVDASLSPDAQLIDAPTNCWGRDLYQHCQTPAPTNFAGLSQLTIDTDSSALCALPLSAPACVLANGIITLDGRLVARGSRPLVLVGVEQLTVQIEGVLDVSSGLPGSPGAGAGSSACGTGIPAGATASNSGGGAGGTFGGRGGFGGSSGTAGAPGGQPAANPSSNVTVPRGGCPGSTGAGSNGAIAGRGGGAVILITGGTLTVNGKVLARGAGGGGADLNGGGGGGGSGGLIALDGINVIVTGALIAAGGGGGGGGNLSDIGSAGGAASETGVPGPGGVGGMALGNGGGGSGGPATLLNGRPGELVDRSGAGGGGGGAGVIRIRGNYTDGTGTIVPPRT
ncbi:MAG: hypothetical protein H0T42_17715 [Deltaproteobacteria bacterium]|nr:hypothetical protein [Deltaproteobacteria bacterium]